jgi:hypothetical protein
MRGISLVVAVMLLWSAPLRASETATGGSEPRVRTKIGLGGGYPEIIALSIAVGVPNVLEGELSAGAFWGRASAALRVGYPWVIVGERRPGWWVSLVPKVGLRVMWQEVVSLFGTGCESGGSSWTRGDEVSAVGLNAVASFEVGYIIGKRFGLLLQLTAGATWLFAGQNDHVTYSCEDTETTRTAEENSPWSPDLRATIVFTF